MSGFKISAAKAAAAVEDEGTTVHVKDHAGTPQYYRAEDGSERPVTITVTGRHSSRYRRAAEAIRKRPFKGKVTGETFYGETIEKAIACTIGWEGFLEDDDSPMELSRANIGRLYQECNWVLDEVSEAIHDSANFSRSSSEALSLT